MTPTDIQIAYGIGYALFGFAALVFIFRRHL